jgi:anthranilate phosphoribosyltransferase
MSKELWDRYFSILESGLDLEPANVEWCMKQILEGKTDNELIKKFLLSLKAKGETSEEVGALVAQMYEYSAPISITERAVDTVGTGGDGAHTINISTTAAIIAAAASAKVVKHGNRAA